MENRHRRRDWNRSTRGTTSRERLRRELIALVEHMRGWATYRSRFPIWVTSVTNA